MRKELLTLIIESCAVAVIRMSDARRLLRVAAAVRKGGITAIEVTLTTPNALKMIEDLAREMGNDIQVGVGSVLDAGDVQDAVNAGARYVVSPVFKPDVIAEAHRLDVPAMPGCFSPTEILAATELGANIIKVFPANITGMGFFKAILAPMPHLKLMPTGGVTPTNAGDWIRAGAVAVGVGSALLDKRAIATGDYDVLTKNARTLRESVMEARSTK